jgi:ABC-type transporter MlaC component
MGKALVAILTEPNLDRAARQDRFRAIYRRHFDHAAIGASALGRPWAQATPAKRGEYLAVLEEYIVKLAVAQLVHFEVERLLVVKSEDLGDSVVVTSLLIHPNPRAMRNIELKWRLAIVDGRLLVRDVVLDKISLALTERRAFASWLRDAGGTIEGLIAILRQKIAET